VDNFGQKNNEDSKKNDPGLILDDFDTNSNGKKKNQAELIVDNFKGQKSNQKPCINLEDFK